MIQPTKIDVLLQACNLSKHFGGLAALTDVSLTIHRHEIYGLIGPNGAGKTTLFNVLTGLYSASNGSIIFDGVNLVGKSPHDVAKAGIVRTFQNIRLFNNMTVLENVMVGRHLHTHIGIFGAILRNQKHVPRKSPLDDGLENYWITLELFIIPKCWQRIYLMAISVDLRSLVPWRLNQGC